MSKLGATVERLAGGAMTRKLGQAESVRIAAALVDAGYSLDEAAWGLLAYHGLGRS